MAQIHVDAWRAAYAGILPADYLDSLSVKKREALWRTVVEQGTPRLLVAKAMGQLIGWIAFGGSRDEGAAADRGEIWAINVSPAVWSKGAGRTLLQAAREELAQAGYRVVTLWVLCNNVRAIRFYRCAGFALDGSLNKNSEIGGAGVTEIRFTARLLDEGRAC